MNHTPEPWFVEPFLPDNGLPRGEILRAPRTLHEDGGVNSEVVVEYKGSPTLADAERIVACVNACRGIPTEALRRSEWLIVHESSGAIWAREE